VRNAKRYLTLVVAALIVAPIVAGVAAYVAELAPQMCGGSEPAVGAAESRAAELSVPFRAGDYVAILVDYRLWPTGLRCG